MTDARLPYPGAMVGCERIDGTLQIHPWAETCAVCGPRLVLENHELRALRAPGDAGPPPEVHLDESVTITCDRCGAEHECVRSPAPVAAPDGPWTLCGTRGVDVKWYIENRSEQRSLGPFACKQHAIIERDALNRVAGGSR